MSFVDFKYDADLFVRGIEEFNIEEFYECHETLEEYWQKLPPGMPDDLSHDFPVRQMVQGVIQIAVGFYHLKRNNVKGALKLFTRGNARLQAFMPEEHLEDIDLRQCVAAVGRNIDLLEQGAVFDDPALTVPRIDLPQPRLKTN